MTAPKRKWTRRKPLAPVPDGYMSLTAFAKHLGVADSIVRRAVRRGRLERSVVRRGRQTWVVDVALAELEWRENADLTKVRDPAIAARLAAPDASTRLGPGPEAPVGAVHPLEEASEANGHRARTGTFADVKRALYESQRRKVEFDIARKGAGLIAVAAVRADWAGHVVEAKRRLLSITHRLKQAEPDVTAETLVILDRLIREALQDLGEGAADPPLPDDEDEGGEP